MGSIDQYQTPEGLRELAAIRDARRNAHNDEIDAKLALGKLLRRRVDRALKDLQQNEDGCGNDRGAAQVKALRRELRALTTKAGL